jgi:hypothetical protein
MTLIQRLTRAADKLDEIGEHDLAQACRQAATRLQEG